MPCVDGLEVCHRISDRVPAGGSDALSLMHNENMTTTLTHATFEEFTGRDGLVLVLFWSTSCGPCLRFRRIYKAVEQQFPDIPFGEAEVEIQFRLVEQLEISTIPVLLVYRDGDLIYRDPTPRPGSATFSSPEGMPRFLDFMYSEERFAAFVANLSSQS